MIHRAAERAEGARGLSCARSAQKYSRRGLLNKGVRRSSKCLSTLTVKTLIILLKYSLIVRVFFVHLRFLATTLCLVPDTARATVSRMFSVVLLSVMLTAHVNLTII